MAHYSRASTVGREHELREDIAQTATRWVDGWDGSSAEDSTAYTARLYNSLNELRQWRTGRTHASDIPSFDQPPAFPRQTLRQDPPLRAAARQHQPPSHSAVVGHTAASTFNPRATYQAAPLMPGGAPVDLRGGNNLALPHFDRFAIGPALSDSARATHGTEDFLRPSALTMTLAVPQLAEEAEAMRLNPRVELEKRKFLLRSTRQMFEDELEHLPVEHENDGGDSGGRGGGATPAAAETAAPAREDDGCGQDDGNGDGSGSISSSRGPAASTGGRGGGDRESTANAETDDGGDDWFRLDSLLLRGSGKRGGVPSSKTIAGGGAAPMEQYFRSVVGNIRTQVGRATFCSSIIPARLKNSMVCYCHPPAHLCSSACCCLVCFWVGKTRNRL